MKLKLSFAIRLRDQALIRDTKTPVSILKRAVCQYSCLIHLCSFFEMNFSLPRRPGLKSSWYARHPEPPGILKAHPEPWWLRPRKSAGVVDLAIDEIRLILTLRQPEHPLSGLFRKVDQSGRERLSGDAASTHQP